MSAKNQLEGSAKVVFLNQGPKPPSNSSATQKLPDPIKEVMDKGKAILQKNLQACFDKIDDLLFQYANSALTHEEQHFYFDSLREIRLQRNGVEKSFSESIQSAFVRLVTEPDTEEDVLYKNIKADSLSLIHNEELEAIVITNSCIAKANKEFGEAIHSISLRLDSLVPVKVYLKNNPFGPDTLCHAFKAELDKLDVSRKIKLIMFKLFDQLVVSDLPKLYDAVNSLLIENNILPSLSYKQSQSEKNEPKINLSSRPRSPQAENVVEQPKQQHYSQPNHYSQKSHYSQGSHYSEESHSVNNNVFYTNSSSVDSNSEIALALNEILGGLQVISPTGIPTGAHTERLPHNILSLLSIAQHSSQPNIGHRVIDIRSLLEELKTVRGMDAPLGRVDEKIIHVVEMLFDFILTDRNLPQNMKAIIAKLQIPLAKAAIIDHSLFFDNAHSARRLLNELASAAMEWEEKSQEQGKDTLFNKINDVVYRVLNTFEQDVSIFSDILEDFVCFREKEKSRAELIERRIVHVEDGKAKFEQTKKAVQDEINQLLAKHKVPELIVDIAQNGWKSVLTVTALKYDYTSKEWHEGLKTLEFLFLSANPPKSDSQRKKYIKLAPIIIQRLKLGFESISFNPSQATKWLKKLEDFHLACIKEDKLTLDEFYGRNNTVDSSSPSQVTPDIGADVGSTASNTQLANTLDEARSALQQNIPEVHPQADSQCGDKKQEVESLSKGDPHLLQVASFSPGSWFDISDQDTSARRCRLAAYIRPTGKYIFVNRSGMKVAEKSQEELAYMLKQGRLCMLDSGILFDRALETVVSGMRRELRS